MQTALVLILLLNGVQISLPKPAVVLQGSAWLPLRPVVERMGGTLNPSSDRRSLLLSARGSRVTLAYINNPGQAKGAVVYSHEGTAYIQARALAEILNGKVHFDDATSTLRLTLPWLGETTKISRSELMANPLRYQSHRVTVSGAALPTSAANSVVKYSILPGQLMAGSSPIPYSLQTSKYITSETNEITGVVSIQADSTPTLTDVTAQALSFAPCFDRATARPGERVILWLPEALRDLATATAAQCLEFSAPSNEIIPITSLSLEKTEEFTLIISPQGWTSWYWTLPAQSVGLNGVVWRVRCRPASDKAWAEGSIWIFNSLESGDK